MKWLLIVLGALVVLGIVAVAVGYSLPVKHTARRSATISAPDSAVWAVITDPGAFPGWRGKVASVELLPSVEGRQSWREKGSDGAITYEVMRAEPPRRLVTRIADRDLPFGGEWEYELAPDGSGTRITITERGEVYNPIFRFVSRFLMGHTATIDDYLRALGRKFGQEVEPVSA
jgi:uncharacterized protein YndB with AHSA1/START domain